MGGPLGEGVVIRGRGGRRRDRIASREKDSHVDRNPIRRARDHRDRRHVDPYGTFMRFGCSESGACFEDTPMMDLIFIAVGIGFFGLMALYARWAANA
jgi:hypothetical protein